MTLLTILAITGPILGFALGWKLCDWWVYQKWDLEFQHVEQKPDPADTPWLRAWRKDFDAKCEQVRAEIKREAET